jgi:hypothetical protein
VRIALRRSPTVLQYLPCVATHTHTHAHLLGLTLFWGTSVGGPRYENDGWDDSLSFWDGFVDPQQGPTGGRDQLFLPPLFSAIASGEYGPLDPARTVLHGWSVGGHMASWLFEVCGELRQAQSNVCVCGRALHACMTQRLGGARVEHVPCSPSPSQTPTSLTFGAVASNESINHQTHLFHIR